MKEDRAQISNLRSEISNSSPFITHHSSFVLALTALLVVLYVGARAWRLTGSCLWFDEIFGVHAARHTWGGLWSFVAADLIHPPLFYALLKIWVAAGGESLPWLRLFPLLAAVACLLPFLLLARSLRLSPAQTNLSLLLFAANGYLIKYAQEVRMYSLLLFFTLGSLWLFVRFLRAGGATRGPLLALAACNLLLIYTHYYGWLVVVTEAAFLLFKDRKKFKPFLLGAAALVLCFAPWVYACAAAAAGEGGGLAQNIGWIKRPRPVEFAQFFALLQEPFYFRQSSHEPLYARGGAFAGLLLLGLPVLLLVLRELTRAFRAARGSRATDTHGTTQTRDTEAMNEAEPEKDAAPPQDDSSRQVDSSLATHFLIFFSFIPPALAFLVSYALPHSVWGTRHLIIAAAPYMLLAAVAVLGARPRWLKITLVVLLCAWYFLAGLLTLARREGTHVWCAWESLAAPLARAEAEGAGRAAELYAFEDLVAYHLWFALGGERGRFRVSVVKNVPGLQEDPAYFLPREFKEVEVRDAGALGGERFWVAFRDTAWDEGRQPLKLLKERGYRAEKIFETGAQGQRAFVVLVSRAQ
ncbi:MAG TPA: glycosyltransferase family 39 protein [Pyrinomonadaceae bacterium]|nr:glycosyltransferase family 39 protein [Pyrinomonadaceae bacterium]